MRVRRAWTVPLSLLSAGAAVAVLGYEIAQLCYERVSTIGGVLCYSGPYLGIGIFVFFAGCGTILGGLAMIAHPSKGVLPSFVQVPVRSVSLAEQRTNHKIRVGIFSIFVLGFILLEIFLITSVPVGTTNGGTFQFDPAFLLDLIPIVAADCVIILVLWIYVVR